MSDQIFLLSDQNGALVGHMSFQDKKIICSPAFGVNFVEWDFKWTFDKFLLIFITQFNLNLSGPCNYTIGKRVLGNT